MEHSHYFIHYLIPIGRNINFWSKLCNGSDAHLKTKYAMKQTGLCIVSLLGGALMGAAIAMLVTPKTGRQMRDSIRGFIEDELERMRCKCHDGACDCHHESAPTSNAQ